MALVECASVGGIGPAMVRKSARPARFLGSKFEDTAEGGGMKLGIVVTEMRCLWKYWGDTQFGIHTITCMGAKLEEENADYIDCLAINANIKGGGINHIVPGILMKPLDDTTMVMGLHVVHPSLSNPDGAPSIAALVASVPQEQKWC
ncbi:hypothetical protein LTR27_007845 [Elasticomyces elasticus]|nr:hypothetical protein LTR27_007845 [Elasticomyces elasticus]